MKGLKRKLRGRWRSALIVGLLSAAILMVGVLALQTAYAYRVHRQVAEGVLRDYARVVADEFIRRTSAEIGYRGYYAVVTALQNRLGGDAPLTLPEPEALPGGARDGRPARELVRTLFLLDAAGRMSTTGAPLDDAAERRLEEAIRSAGALTDPSDEPFHVLHDRGGDGQRTFIYASVARASDAPVVAGFEVDFGAMEPWLRRVVDSGPLLPASLGEGELDNDLLSLRLNDAVGKSIFSSGRGHDPVLSTYTPLGDTYSGIFKGMTLVTSIHPDAAPQMIIGGLPRSRLPILGWMLAITVGLLVAAIHQLRRERALARLRSDFVSRVSHELRTPLTQIRMFAETLLLGRDRTEEERRRSIEIVDQEARRLSHLVENILQFSRGDRDAIRLAPRPQDMAELLRDVAEKFLPVARARQVRLVPVLADDVVCLVDNDAMTQVALNLLDNAVKYGPAGQEVRYGLESDGRHARLWVDDEGPGIPEKEHRRIWRRWQRLERDERSAVAGTGIGLTVVRDLVSMHGGRVWCERSERGGARFVVELPLMAADPEDERSASAIEGARRLA